MNWRYVLNYKGYRTELMQAQLREDILKNLDLSPNNFKLFLQQIAKCPESIKVIAQLIKQNTHNFQTCQRLGTSINFIIEQNFIQIDKNPELWTEYFNHIATNCNIEWKINKIFQRSLTTFMESFSDQFDNVMSNSYPRFTGHHQILAINSIINGCQFTPKTRYSFISKSLENYLNLGAEFLSQTQQYMEKQSQDFILNWLGDLILEYLLSLKETLFFISMNSHPDSNWENLINEISMDPKLFQILKGFMFITHSKKGVVFEIEGSSFKQQTFNNIKAISIECLVELVDRYHRRSTLEQFDTYPVLQLMETEIPRMIEELNIIDSKILQLDCNSILCISILKFIKKASEFIFMNNYFWEHYRFIFWRIVYPLIQINDEEIREYHDDPEGFIKQAQSLVEELQQSEASLKNCKCYASALLQSLCEMVDGALSYFVAQVLGSLEDILRSSEVKSEGIHIFKASLLIESCLSLLTILTTKIRGRRDLSEQLIHRFHENQKQLLAVKGIDLARLFIFMQYNYQTIYGAGEDGKNFFYLAADCLKSDNETIMKSSLGFFKEYKHLDVSGVVWDQLVVLIPQTQYADLLCLIAEIVQINCLNFPNEGIMNILEKTLGRVSKQMDLQIQQKRVSENNEPIKQTCTLQCLKTIKYIALNAQQRSNTFQIYKKVFKLFDYISAFSIIESDDEIIEILNILLMHEKVQMLSEYFKFLGDFMKYHIKEKSTGLLFETYVIMINKGRSFLGTEEGRKSLDQIVINLLKVIDFCIQSTICKPILLLQILMIYYPSSLNHHSLFQRTFEAYRTVLGRYNDLDEEQTQKKGIKNKHKKIIGYFAALWLLGSVSDPVAYQQGQNITLQCQAHFFKGINIKAIGYAIKQKTKVLIHDKIIQDIPKWLKFGIKILEYRVSVPQTYISKSQEMIEVFKETDITSQIREAFKLCKQQLGENDYQTIIKQVEEQVPLKALKDLISQYTVNNETRRVVKIAKAS